METAGAGDVGETAQQHNSAEHADTRSTLHGFIEKADGRTQGCAWESECWHYEGLAPPEALDVGEELLRNGDWEEGRDGDDPVKGIC